MLDDIARRSELTEKDVLEIDESVKKGLAEKYPADT